MYVDPQKARREEQERQAKLLAEQRRQAKLRQQEEDRNAKLREEENQRAKQRAKAKESESSEGKNSEVKPKNKKPIEQKPEGKKAQNPQTSETKKPDKGTNQTEIAPLNVSTAPVSGQPSLTTPESKPQKPLDRKARTWTGEGDAEPEPQPAAHPIQRSEKEIAYREEVARKQAVKQEERRQKRLQEETKPTETQPEANESSSAPLFPAKPDIKIAASSLSPGVLGTLSEPHLLKSETPLKVNSPTPAEQLALQPSGLVSPVITFQETLKTNALNRLQQNRTRLDQSQQRFSDPDPKNQNWNALRQQSTVVATLNAREQTAKKKLLEAYRNATGDRVSSPFPLFNGFTSPAERRQLALGFYQKQLGPQWKPLAPQIESLINEIYVADSLRAGLYAQEPALAVLTPWELQRANTPEENRELQRKIHGEFGLARGGIQQLEKLLQTDKNSAVALKFDQVVGQTLAGIKDPKQRQQVLDWVEQQQQAEQDRQTQDTMGLAAATFMAVGASTLGVGSLALIFGGIGAFQGGKMSIDALSQAGVNQDALKAGGAGGQRLTAMNPHQAQMDYQMAMVNVGLSLLDAGVAVNSIRQVLNSRQAVQAFSKLKPHQVEQFAEATRLGQAGKAAEAQKKLQQLEGEVGEETFKQVTRTGGRLGLSTESGSIRLGGAAEEAPALKGKVEPEVISKGETTVSKESASELITSKVGAKSQYAAYVKYAKGYGKEIGHYDATTNPGPLGPRQKAIETLGSKVALQKSFASTFAGGRYTTLELEKPMIVYRAWAPGTKSGEFGNFWSLEKPQGSLQTTIDSALKPEWSHIYDRNGNKMPGRTQATKWVAIEVPPGTQIHVGQVGSQGEMWVGGGSQVVIDRNLINEDLIKARGDLQ